MSITQQYLLDTYRAARHDERTPPAPGTQDWQVIREVRDYGRFRAVVGERPARGRIRAWLAGVAARAGLSRGSAVRIPRPRH
ncbi:hypothetical protein [Streptomyces longisporoflavus]|uniref:Uncharacterized protein n=1 Tax=Streptomyces longisporoflavus TaxID=28044 RepID=A0ABW7QXX7_9ACTN|nr:hypothetical protein [Streptomyces longisporoflavus]GGV54849.1 hypothetical protein GCM10010277_54070 [Streptomyces longisporoflavus]